MGLREAAIKISMTQDMRTRNYWQDERRRDRNVRRDSEDAKVFSIKRKTCDFGLLALCLLGEVCHLHRSPDLSLEEPSKSVSCFARSSVLEEIDVVVGFHRHVLAC